jgi:L-fuconolactonase
MTIIDTHTHFYDPLRPQGVPWPRKDDAFLYRTYLPKDYRSQPVPQAVTGTVVVEASPWVEDNQWVLDIAAKDPFIVGLVGNLPTGKPEFAAHLKRFATNPLFRGIRIKHALLKAGFDQPAFLSDLCLLAKNDLELDLYGGPALLTDVAKLAELLPELRIVINHVANVKIDGQAADAPWRAGMRAASMHKHVFCKISALVEGTGRNDGTAPHDVTFYHSVLDVVCESFGEDRVIYGSNWPVSERFAPLATVQGIVTDYFTGKGRSATEKFFSKNAAEAYRWVS